MCQVPRPCCGVAQASRSACVRPCRRRCWASWASRGIAGEGVARLVRGRSDLACDRRRIRRPHLQPRRRAEERQSVVDVGRRIAGCDAGDVQRVPVRAYRHRHDGDAGIVRSGRRRCWSTVSACLACPASPWPASNMSACSLPSSALCSRRCDCRVELATVCELTILCLVWPCSSAG